MWTYITRDNLPNFLNQYPHLTEFLSQLSLYETKDAIMIPRLMNKTHPSQFLVPYQGKKELNIEPININFKGDLRPLQAAAASIVLKTFKTQGNVNGILKLFPGAGKTVLSVYLASMLGMKTCIIVDNNELMKQWIESFLNFTDLTIDDIGIIRGKTFLVDRPVTIAMTQSLLSKLKTDFNKAFVDIDDARFGLIVYDEVHATSSSEKFAKVSVLFRTQNILGLSATPFQSGIAEILMNNTIGKMLYETKDYDLTPEYYLVYYDSELAHRPSGWKSKKTGDDISISQRLQRTPDFIRKRAIYNSKLVESGTYLDTIVKYTKNLLNNDYVIFITCMTKKQVTVISDRLTQAGIDHRRFYGDENEIDKDNDKVVVATYAYSGKGFDMVRLSALILATPLSGKKSLIQVVGRILRSKDGKKKPIVIDLVDKGFSLMFIPEVKRKVGIIKNEFPNAKIYEYIEEGENVQ